MSLILIIDDNPCVRTMLKYILNNYQVLEAKDGTEGLNHLKKHKNIKLVITDYQMPGVNGLEICKWVKKNRPQTAVILITACNKIILGAHKLEVVHVFPKPFEDIDYILEQIKRIMGG
jgi:two-component system, OmpR family, response regulator ResD